MSIAVAATITCFYFFHQRICRAIGTENLHHAINSYRNFVNLHALTYNWIKFINKVAVCHEDDACPG